MVFRAHTTFCTAVTSFTLCFVSKLELTLRTVGFNQNGSGVILHYVPPVDLRGIAQVTILDDLDASFQYLCRWHTFKSGKWQSAEQAWTSLWLIPWITATHYLLHCIEKQLAMGRSSRYTGSWAVGLVSHSRAFTGTVHMVALRQLVLWGCGLHCVGVKCSSSNRLSHPPRALICSPALPPTL